MTKQPRQIVHSFTSLWEYECCGEPLAVGDEVTLNYLPFEPDEVWSPLQPIDWYVGHHALDERHQSARVRVLELWEAYAEREYHPAPARYYADQPGTGRLVAIDRMTTHSADWRADMPEPPATYTPTEPSGWVMRLDVFTD